MGDVDWFNIFWKCDRYIFRLCVIPRHAPQANMKDFIKTSPSLVVQRNILKPYANIPLAQNHAFQTGKRMAVWRAFDLASNGRPLGEDVLRHLENMKPSDTGDMWTWQMFFEGIRLFNPPHSYFSPYMSPATIACLGLACRNADPCHPYYLSIRYTFPKSEHPKVRWTTNTVCYGVQMVFHTLEPEDDLSQPFRRVRMPPKGVIVRPEGPCIGRIDARGWVPEGCLFIGFDANCKFTIRLPEAMQLYGDGEETGYTVQIKRRGLCLGSAYTPTTFFAQGVSFKKDKYFLDVCPPADGHFSRANIVVPISRPNGLEDVHPLLLWTDAEGRKRVFEAYKRALKPVPDRVADKLRLQQCHDRTRTANDALWRQCERDTEPRQDPSVAQTEHGRRAKQRRRV